MRILVLADDESVLPWMDSLRQRGDELAFCWTPSVTLRETLQESWPDVKLIEREAISDCEADDVGVLVGGRGSDVFVEARQLGQCGRPILVVTASAGPTSSLFELMPLWEEGRTQIVPAFDCPLAALSFQENSPFRPDRIEFERTVSPAGPLNLQRVYELFFQDVYALHQLGSQLNADGQSADWEAIQTVWTGQQEKYIAAGSIMLSGGQLPESTWTLKSGPNDGWKLTLWKADQSTQFSSSDVSAEYLDASRLDMVRQFGSPEGSPPVIAATGWEDVMWSGHLLAAAQNSATRQRRVAIQQESGSERSQFKTQMATFGCGALLWAMFGAIGLLGIASALDPRDREQKAAEVAGFVLTEVDFVGDSAQLTEEGAVHVQQISEDWSSTTAPVIVVDSGQSTAANERRETVAETLTSEYGRDDEQRVLVRQLKGVWFQRLVVLGWCLVFGPLGLVLLAQVLIVASHPGRESST
ncbi:MAG: hypothetical protein KDA88_04605 [Planctomycetaceae bacterium]|nr:hypothetical protein [Planctomycetaceae bacterium]MCB9950152.1 hypothetical protein [Planctomycetaceae bacterium]